MDVHQIPIINYHKIESQYDIGITSRHPGDFLSDMFYLASQNFTTITFLDLYNNSTLPERPIIITFDDGYESVYSFGFPILQKFNYKAVVFIPTDFINKQNDWDVQFGTKRFKHLSGQQLKQLNKAGFEIASHGRAHLPFTAMDESDLKLELQSSKQQLESLTGNPVVSICYPFGRFNTEVIQTAKNAGYKYGMASLYFRSCEKNYIPYALRRFNIYRFDGLSAFKHKLSLNYNSLLGYRDWFLQLGGRVTPLYQQFKQRR